MEALKCSLSSKGKFLILMTIVVRCEYHAESERGLARAWSSHRSWHQLHHTGTCAIQSSGISTKTCGWSWTAIQLFHALPWSLLIKASEGSEGY